MTVNETGTTTILPSIQHDAIPIKRLVMAAVEGSLDIPEFQRSFVWKPQQVRDLAESICSNYPIGTVLCWHNPDYTAPRKSVKAHQSHWIIDGQQRTTALCLIVGRKPHWYRDKDWAYDMSKFETWVDVCSPLDELNFETRRTWQYASKKWVSIREICRRKEEDLAEYAGIVKRQLPEKYRSTDEGHILSIFRQLNRQFESLEPTKAYNVQQYTIGHNLESVATIFARLNSGGTAVRETDTILAYIGVHHPGWVRKEFLPFQEALTDEGFDFDSSLLVRTITGIGARRTRIKEVPKDWWRSPEHFPDAWKRTRDAVTHVLKVLSQNFGILTTDVLPAKNALIPLFALYDKFPDRGFKPGKALHWLLLASWEGRFGGASATALDEDLKAIEEAGTFPKAYSKLLANLEYQEDIVQEKHLDELTRPLFISQC